MTVFERHVAEVAGEPDHYGMLTMISDRTADLLQSFQDFGGNSAYEALSQAVTAENWYRLCKESGGIVLAYSAERIEPLVMPSQEFTDDDGTQPMMLCVEQSAKDALDPLVDPDNPRDLVGYWRASVKFYSELCERQVQGDTFHAFYPGDTIENALIKTFNMRSPWAVTEGPVVADEPAPDPTSQPPTAGTKPFDIRRWLSRRRDR